jgi:hypothetical protein
LSADSNPPLQSSLQLVNVQLKTWYEGRVQGLITSLANARAFQHSTNIGSALEDAVRALLSELLPPTRSVGEGEIIGVQHQLDAVVYNSSTCTSMPIGAASALFIPGSVSAVMEVKAEFQSQQWGAITAAAAAVKQACPGALFVLVAVDSQCKRDWFATHLDGTEVDFVWLVQDNVSIRKAACTLHTFSGEMTHPNNNNIVVTSRRQSAFPLLLLHYLIVVKSFKIPSLLANHLVTHLYKTW